MTEYSLGRECSETTGSHPGEFKSAQETLGDAYLGKKNWQKISAYSIH